MWYGSAHSFSNARNVVRGLPDAVDHLLPALHGEPRGIKPLQSSPVTDRDRSLIALRGGARPPMLVVMSRRPTRLIHRLLALGANAGGGRRRPRRVHGRTALAVESAPHPVGVREWPGTGATTFVCISGLGRSVDDWALVGPGLAQHGRVLAIELPAMTRSWDGPVGDLLKSHRAAIAALARTKPPARMILVGHSMGAVVALFTAAADPGWWAGVVLTGPFMPVARGGRSRTATARDYARHRLLFVRDAVRERGTGLGLALTTGGRRAGLRSLASTALRPHAFHARAEQVTCPVLVIHGENDHYVPPAFVSAGVARHPGWRLDLVPAAGHFPHRQQPEHWLASVERWLPECAPQAR